MNIVFLSLILIVPFTLIFAASPNNTHSKASVFTYQTKLDKNDQRYNYDFALLKLSLEKTKEKYGAFTLVPLYANYKKKQ